VNLSVSWLDHGREPKEKPDPDYPEGKDIDIALGAKPACKVALPYPAPRCGIYLVTCETCGLRVGVTTAGRPDDPRSVSVACRRRHGVPAGMHPFTDANGPEVH